MTEEKATDLQARCKWFVMSCTHPSFPAVFGEFIKRLLQGDFKIRPTWFIANTCSCSQSVPLAPEEGVSSAACSSAVFCCIHRLSQVGVFCAAGLFLQPGTSSQQQLSELSLSQHPACHSAVLNTSHNLVTDDWILQPSKVTCASFQLKARQNASKLSAGCCMWDAALKNFPLSSSWIYL